MSGKSDKSGRWQGGGGGFLSKKTMARSRHGDLGQWEQELASIFSTSGSPFLKPTETAATKQDSLKRMLQINSATTQEDLAQLELKHVLWSSLGIYSFFKLNLNKQNLSMRKWMRRRNLERSKQLYADLMQKILSADIEEDIILYILDFLTEFRLWRYEHLCIDVLDTPMKCGGTGAALLGDMLDRLETLGGKNEQEARHILRVLYDVLNVFFWPSLDPPAAKAITRLLKLYRIAVRVEYEQELVLPVASGSYARKGLEVCIRRIIEHMENSDLMLIVGYMVEWVFDRKLGDETILDFGTVLEHAAIVHQSEHLRLTFTHQLFDSLFDIVGSERRVVSHLGNRILHQLLDRHDNRLQFETPKIFFQNTHFNINVVECIPQDKEFLKKHRPKIHESIMRAIIKHAMHRVNLESIYTTICLLATEVPSGYTAAALANLVMNIQEAARSHTGYRSQVQYHLHAMVLGVLSLLCWLHNAPDFYKYVNKIMNLRAEQAPHLNPPLRISYMFAQHHVLWDKPELFFDDWEVRYSLWMRFKIKDTEAFLKKRKAAAPPMKEELEEAANTDPSLSAHVPKLTRRQQLEPYLPVRKPLSDLDERWLREQEERLSTGSAIFMGKSSSESSLTEAKKKKSGDKGRKSSTQSSKSSRSTSSKDSKSGLSVTQSKPGKKGVLKDNTKERTPEEDAKKGHVGIRWKSRAEQGNRKTLGKSGDRESKTGKGTSLSISNKSGDKTGSRKTESREESKKDSSGKTDSNKSENGTQKKTTEKGKTRSARPDEITSDEKNGSYRKHSLVFHTTNRKSQLFHGKGSRSEPNLDPQDKDSTSQDRGKARATVARVSDEDKPPKMPDAKDTLNAVQPTAQSPSTPQSKSAPASATSTERKHSYHSFGIRSPPPSEPQNGQGNKINPNQSPTAKTIFPRSQSVITEHNQMKPTQTTESKAAPPADKLQMHSPSEQSSQTKPTQLHAGKASPPPITPLPTPIVQVIREIPLDEKALPSPQKPPERSPSPSVLDKSKPPLSIRTSPDLIASQQAKNVVEDAYIRSTLADNQAGSRKVSVSSSAPRHLEARNEQIITFHSPTPKSSIVARSDTSSSAASLAKNRAPMRKGNLSDQYSSRRSSSVPGQNRMLRVPAAHVTSGVRRGSTPNKRSQPAQRRVSTVSTASMTSYRGMGALLSEESAELSITSLMSQTSSQLSTHKKERSITSNSSGTHSKNLQQFHNTIDYRHGGPPSPTKNKKQRSIHSRNSQVANRHTIIASRTPKSFRTPMAPMSNTGRVSTSGNIRAIALSAMTSPINNRQTFVTSAIGSSSPGNKENSSGRPNTR